MEKLEVLSGGMLFAIGILLLLVSLLHFFKEKQYDLGLIAFIWGSSTIHQQFFAKGVFSNLLYDILFADFRQILIIPLAYIFLLRKFGGNEENRSPWRHLIFPLGLVVFYLVIKYVNISLGNDQFLNENYFVFTLMRIVPLVLFFTYYILGIQLLSHMRSRMVKSLHFRYRFMYHLICLYLTSMLIYLITAVQYGTSFFYTSPLILSIESLLDFMILGVVFSFLISELSLFKRFFPQKNIFLNSFDSEQTKEFEGFIADLVYREAYTNHDFSLQKELAKVNLNESEFRNYILTKLDKNVSEYLNDLRVQKFIKLLQTVERQKYDLVGLSKLAGFKSKSTFYRVFKQIMGVSPKEYLENSK